MKRHFLNKLEHTVLVESCLRYFWFGNLKFMNIFIIIIIISEFHWVCIDLDCRRGIQATLEALIVVFKSVILGPPCFLSPMMVDFFVFAGFHPK